MLVILGKLFLAQPAICLIVHRGPSCPSPHQDTQTLWWWGQRPSGMEVTVTAAWRMGVEGRGAGVAGQGGVCPSGSRLSLPVRMAWELCITAPAWA